MKARLASTFPVAMGFFLMAACVRILPVGEAPLMHRDRLVTLLENPSVVIVDVRHDIQWDESPTKIKGAIRGEAKSIDWALKYPKDTLLVLYCA